MLSAADATLPIVTYLGYDGQTTISATWSAPPSPAYVIGLFQQGTLIKRSPALHGLSGSLTTDAPLTGTGYAVAVAPSDGADDLHAFGDRVGVLTASVTGVTARCDPQSIAASWTLQGTVAGSARLWMQIVDSDAGRVEQPVTGTSVTLSRPELRGDVRLQFQVRADAGNAVGPLVSLPLVIALPAAAQVSYETDAGARIGVTFAGTAPSGCAPAVTLLRQGVPVSTTRGRGTRVSVPLAAPLASDAKWAVTLAWVLGGATSESAPVELITAQANEVKARYDLTAVTASWARKGTAPPGAQLVVALSDAGGERARQPVAGSSVTLPVATPLGADARLQFQVTTDTVTGPLVVVPLVTEVPPTAAGVSYDTGPGKPQVAVTVVETAPAGLAPAVLLLRDGALVRSATGQGTQVTVQPAAPLDLESQWQVSLAWSAGGAIGPTSEPVELITAPPAISDAELLADGSVVVNWRAQPRPPWVTSGWAKLEPLTDPGGPGQAVTTSPATFVPSPTPPPGSTYALTLASVRGVVRGPASNRVLLPNVATPLGSTSYDGETVDVWWDDPAPEGATGCLVEVLAQGLVIASGPGGGIDPAPASQIRGSVRAKLDSRGSYTARLRWVSGTVTGPPGPEAPVIAGLTSVGAVQPTADGIEMRISEPPAELPTDTVYVPHLMQGGVDVAAGAGVSQPPAIAQLAYQCDDQTTLTVRAQASYVSGNCHCYGPLGPPAPVLAVPPAITQATLRGTMLDISWTLPPDPLGAVSATRIVVTPSGSGDLPAPVTFPRVTGTHALLDLKQRLDSKLTWTATAAVVSANGPFPSVSPPSPGVRLPTYAPNFTKAIFDGQAVTAWYAWPDAGPNTATGVRLELRSGSAVAGQAVTSERDGWFPVPAPLHFDLPVLLTANPVGPGAEYTDENGLPMIGWAPDKFTATCDAAGVTLDWREPPDPGNVITEYEVAFSTPGDQVTVRRAVHDSRYFPFPAELDPLTPTKVAVRAVGGSSGAEISGPYSEPVPLLRGTPTVTEATVTKTTESGGLLRLAWTPVLGDLEGYAVTLTLDGATTTTWQAGTSALLPVSGSPAAGSVEVQARRGSAASAPATAELILGAPELTAVGWDGSVLTATWNPLGTSAAVNGYELTVRDGDVVVATSRTDTATTAASIALPAGAAGLAVTVAALALPSRGPDCPPVTLPAPGPTPASVTVDPATGKATVAWTAPSPAPAAGYLVQLYRAARPDGEPVDAPATSLELADEPASYDDLEVAVAVKTVTGTATVTGPFGPRLRVLTEPAEIRDMDFDGRTAEVSWTPVPGAAGYALTVLSGDVVRGQYRADGNQTAARFTVTLADLSLGYQVTVQPLRGGSSGVRSTAPLVRDGLYVLPAPARVIHASTVQVTPQPVDAYLPDLAAPDEQLSNLPITLDGPAPPFTLKAAPSTAAPMKYLLRIDNGALAFDSTRETLRQAYREFLKRAEDNGATPRGILALQQAIARLMPQTFDETLYYSYGLSADGWVDLRPGMVLRVSFSGFDLTAVDGAPQWSSGYVGGTVADYDIGDYVSADGSGWLVGFDAFIDWLVARGALGVPAPQAGTTAEHADITQAGGADAADLSYPLFSRPFYRLLIPSQLQAATGPAVSRTSQQFTIAAAAKWKDIDAATAAPGGGVSVAYFRGRAVLRACIRVEVNGAEHVVPVGTTVGNLLDRAARRPPTAPPGLRGVRLYRAPGPVVLDPAQGYDAAALSRVHLDWQGTAAWPAVAQDALSLPLLHGDRVVFGAGG